MRIKTKVTDLNLRQWDYLMTQVRVNGRKFVDGLPRLCVEFELTPDFHQLHIEMDVTEFAGLVTTLESIKNEVAVDDIARVHRPPAPEQARANHPSRTGGPAESMASLTMAPCDHGSPVVHEELSLFVGAKPTRTYADGCQSYGPYQHDDLLDGISEFPSSERPDGI